MIGLTYTRNNAIILIAVGDWLSLCILPTALSTVLRMSSKWGAIFPLAPSTGSLPPFPYVVGPWQLDVRNVSLRSDDHACRDLVVVHACIPVYETLVRLRFINHLSHLLKLSTVTMLCSWNAKQSSINQSRLSFMFNPQWWDQDSRPNLQNHTYIHTYIKSLIKSLTNRNQYNKNDGYRQRNVRQFLQSE